MKDAATRVQEITDYLTFYKQKIQTLNAVGLLDSAVLFELFAVKLCELWFGKPFSNLNNGKANFESDALLFFLHLWKSGDNQQNWRGAVLQQEYTGCFDSIHQQKAGRHSA